MTSFTINIKAWAIGCSKIWIGMVKFGRTCSCRGPSHRHQMTIKIHVRIKHDAIQSFFINDRGNRQSVNFGNEVNGGSGESEDAGELELGFGVCSPCLLQ